MIVLVALVCAAPFVSAWVAYYFIKPEGGKSYGELLPVLPVISEQDRVQLGDDAVKGKWLLIQQEQALCDTACAEALYATRQARTMLGRERDRVVRVLTIQNLQPEIASQHPDLLTKAGAGKFDLIVPQQRGLVLIDPLGNQVMLWPKSPDIKKLNQDLSRLMRASRIG